jgi:anti-sigma regulatory factor (Ser/Thr protein kinase)
MTCHLSVPVRDSSQPASARYAAQEHAERAGFDEQDVHRAGLVATELATNLVKHANGGGELLFHVVTAGAAGEIEIVALDKGPGLADISAALRDGYSTAGSPGTGLGAARRLSDEFEVQSSGKGTAIWVRLRAKRAAASAVALPIAGVSVAMPGEPVCGDAWAVRRRNGSSQTLIADGLGHGLHASEAAAAASSAFVAGDDAPSGPMLERLHAALRATRGAAAAVLTVDASIRTAMFAGVGNIGAAIVSQGTIRHAVSHNGTLGHEARQIRGYQYPWPAGAVFVMHSDGLLSHWQLSDYPGLIQRHPALIAAVLYRDYARGRDDVTVVVGRESA